MDIDFIWRFGKSLQNAYILLQDRGYAVTGVTEAGCDKPFEIIGSLYTQSILNKKSLAENCRQTFYRKDHKGSILESITLLVFDRNVDLIKNKSRMISTDQVKAMQDTINSINAAEGNGTFGTAAVLVIAPNKLSPQAKKEKLVGPNGEPVDIFIFDDLLIDLPRHEMVNKHTLISLEKLQTILGATLNPSDLPQLPTSDPISRWYAFSKGQIVHVENPVMPTFRIVV
jgi:DNA-directed RNA polymerase subunit H (RpoH/RPB5)